ncbi:dihydroorotate dehydrogenase [archaeon SCG-AAA382B04]|nr:dihydroorotate dehydrogenase [archaeon SCG-AAA382B04]
MICDEQYKRIMSLEIEINGKTFESPLMNAAGILGTTASSLKRLADNGSGAVVTKTISHKPKEGNKGPNLIETNYGALNSMGLPNPGAKNYLDELKSLKPLNKPVICSVFGETPRDVKKVGRLLKEYVDIFELNLSCPNIEGEVISSDPEIVKKYVEEFAHITNKPIWVKLSPSSDNIVNVSLAASEAGADSLVLINTLKGMLIDIESGRPILGNKTGGLSGEAIHPIAIEIIYQVYKKIDIPIIGVGGVSDNEKAIEMVMAGAKALQIGTALKDDIGIFKRINKGIKSYLQEKNIDLMDIVGLSHKY